MVEIRQWEFNPQLWEKLEKKSALAELIIRAHPIDYVSAVIFGDRRVGKSIYALKVMMQIFQAFGCDEEEAWRLALDSMYFNIDEFLKAVKQIVESGIVYPVICLDDAGVGISAHKWFTDRHGAEAFKAVLDTIGTVTSGLLMTTPDPQSLLKCARNPTFFVKIVKAGGAGEGGIGWMRQASALRTLLFPDGKVWYSKGRGFRDDFSAYLEDKKYQEYVRKRRMYTAITVDMAVERMERKREVREEKEETRKVAKEAVCDLCATAFPLYRLTQVPIEDRQYLLCPSCHKKWLKTHAEEEATSTSSASNEYGNQQ